MPIAVAVQRVMEVRNPPRLLGCRKCGGEPGELSLIEGVRVDREEPRTSLGEAVVAAPLHVQRRVGDRVWLIVVADYRLETDAGGEERRIRPIELVAQIVETLQVAYIQVNYAKAKKLGELMVGSGRGSESRGRGNSGTEEEGILTPRGSVMVDEFTNTLIVRDIDRGVRNARELVRRLDVQIPQVLIESNIVEATTDFARELKLVDGRYKVVNGLGEFFFEIRADRESGVIDMLAGPSEDSLALFPTRVVPLADGGSAFTFTMFQAPGQPEEQFEGQFASLRKEFGNLERRFDRPSR